MITTNFSFDQCVALLAQSTSFYLVKIDTQGNYVYMNNHFISRHRAYYNDVEIRSAALALHPDDYDLSYQTYQKCVANPDQTFGTTLRKLDGKGGYIITYWEYKVDLSAEGTVTGVIGIGYDVTAFESRKEHIRFLTETLNQLAEQQSHDLRRPLANVMGLIEVLKTLGEENQHLIDVIEKLRVSCDQLNDEFEVFMIRDLKRE